MAKLTVTSDVPMSEAEMKEELIKAIRTNEDKKVLRDTYLKSRKDRTANAVHLVFQSMLNEIERVLEEKQ